MTLVETIHMLSQEAIDRGKEMFRLSAEYRKQVEEKTRIQSAAKDWYYIQAKQITSSMFVRF